MTSSDGLDLSNWMANLRDTIRDVPLVYMAIPGSHDSMINAVIPGKTAPDGPEWLGKISELFPGKVSGWVITQTLDVSQQLNAGIRYFDLRIGCFEGGFRFLHGLYSPYQVQELSKVNDFLNKHPKEVVVLDLQHVYNCTEAQKMELAGILKTIFGRKICNRVELPLNLCTLNNMAQKAFQVIVIFRDFEGESSFWSGSWPTPWPQKTKTSDLKNYLETYIQTRQLEEGYVTQCVLTPDFNFIMENIYSGSIKKTCAEPVLQDLGGWISNRKSGFENWPSSYNVFIADHIDLNGCAFVKAVVGINKFFDLDKNK